MFLAAYASSGLAGLIYEVTWARLLTLYMGHGTAAVSTVVAAFMGGLAAGSLLGGRAAPRLTPRESLHAYVALECLIALFAIAVPYELGALRPLLHWSYAEGASSGLFAAIRLLSCLTVLSIPAVALGATFPIAIRCYVSPQDHPGRAAGQLYAANTVGAATGALAAGFLLLPSIGIRATTFVGIAFGGLAAISALVVAKKGLTLFTLPGPPEVPGARAVDDRKRRRTVRPSGERAVVPHARWIVAASLGVSGLAALAFEIVWTRVLSMTIGPTTYAFSATLTMLIGGTACGAAAGSWIAGRTRRPALWMVSALAVAAIGGSGASSLAGGYVPRLVAQYVAQSGADFNQWLPLHALLAATLIVPLAVGLGAAFPLGLEMAAADPAVGVAGVERPFSVIYAINTLAAVVGALLAGFVAIPYLGLERTLNAVCVALTIAALIIAWWGTRSPRARWVRVALALTPLAMLAAGTRWDRDLLASGAYKYASYVDKDLDLETALTAGELLYYRDGAAATISVKRLTGRLSLSIDGKVDASNGGDMLTQKALAHVPLLLHADPHDVCIIGLGSGVTLGSALVHPIAHADVVELSPEVVEASKYFSADNHDALADPRVHLIVGDGRSHLLLSSRRYDVIISEPSNPWMAGVAALFTREFFTAARDRLAPGGIMCQWAHTYDISDVDLRSIVATVSSVFPNATLWMVGTSDLLLVASMDPLDARLPNIERAWRRPGVAADLKQVGVAEPFSLVSLFTEEPPALRRYASGAPVQTDDRMALEFSGPRAVSMAGGGENAAQLLSFLNPQADPPFVRRARDAAGAAEWRNRAAMFYAASDAKDSYADYRRAVTLDPADAAALDGLVHAAVAAHRETDALDLLQSSQRAHPRTAAIWMAISKLFASGGALDEALAAARQACEIQADDPAAIEQLASILHDSGDAAGLAPVVTELERLQPAGTAAAYYAAAWRFLTGRFAEAAPFAERAIAVSPRFGAAYNLLGAIQANLGHSREARDAFTAALRVSPGDAATYVNLGLLDMAAGDHVAAVRDFAEALSLEPKSAAARQGLAEARGFR